MNDDYTNEPNAVNGNSNESAADLVAEHALGEDGSPVVMEGNMAEETEEQAASDSVVDQSPDTDDYDREQDVDGNDSEVAKADEALVNVDEVNEALSETNAEVRAAQEAAFDRDPEGPKVEPEDK